jgi:glycosyltransferase involved in cell wall biosynthesis
MVTYNHAHFIAQAIDCVLQQKANFPFELVIGEDCSTDRTREIVFEYQKRYPDLIKVITSEQNVGMKRNGYRTTKACRGKYVAFCDGDDFWHHPEKMQKQVDYLESHPECGIVFADCDVYYDKSGKLINSFNYFKGYRTSRNLTVEEVLSGGLIRFTCSAILRRSLAEEIIENDPYLYQSEDFLMGDTQLWTELALQSVVSYMPETMATYRVLENSASRNKDPEKAYRFWKSAYEMMIYLCDKHNLSDDLRKKADLAWCDVCLRLACDERNANLANEVLLKKKMFNWKERLRYYGARNIVVHYIYRVGAFFPALLRKKNSQWP